VFKYVPIGACTGALGLPLLVGTVPLLLLFTVEGVATGSIAALLMTCHAGYIPIGGFVATMQSIGTMGIYIGFDFFTVATGCLAGMGLGGYKALYIDDFVVSLGALPSSFA